MKLLLTSGGLLNYSLTYALLELVGKPPGEIKVAFIPTAMNTMPGDKRWVIAQMVLLREMNVEQIDIVEIAGVPKDVWLPRLQKSHVIFVNGGDAAYLLDRFKRSGLAKELPGLLKTRVYVGVDAGSYIATPDLRLISSKKADKIPKGLRLVNFGLLAHYRSPKFPLAKTFDDVKKRVKGCPYTVYALDDQMAVKVNDDKIELVGEGYYAVFEGSKRK